MKKPILISIGVFIALSICFLLGFYYPYDKYHNPNKPDARLLVFYEFFYHPVYKLYCQLSGGRIASSLSEIAICAHKTTDAGKVCRDSSECESYCLCDQDCHNKALSSKLVDPKTGLITHAEYDNPVTGECWQWSWPKVGCEVRNGKFDGLCATE